MKEHNYSNKDDLPESLRNALLLYWSGELSGEEAKEIEDKLEHSIECQNYLAELAELDVHFDNESFDAVGNDAVADVIEQYSQQSNDSGRIYKFPVQWVIPFAAAAVLGVSLFIVQSFKNSKNEGLAIDAPSKQVEENIDSDLPDELISPNSNAPSTYSQIAKANRSFRLFSSFTSREYANERSFKSTRDKLNKLKIKFNKS